MRRSIAILLFVASTGPTAWAYDTDGLVPALSGGIGPTTHIDLATEHFKRGLDYYRAENWRLARFEFQAAYELSHSPDLLHNLSMVAERQGLLDEAILLEERFLVDKDAKLEPEERRISVERLRLLKELRRPSPPPIPVPKLDESPIAKPSVAEPVPPVKTGKSTSRNVRTAGALLVGIGAGLTITGLGLGIGAAAKKTAIEHGGPYFLDELAQLQEQTSTMGFSGVAVGSLGALLIVSGAGLLVYYRYAP